MPRMARFQPPGGLVAFLAVDGEVVHLAAMVFYKLLGLDEHASRAATGVKDPAFKGLQHFDQKIGRAHV